MLGDIPIISPLFQTLLNGIGWVLAFLYDVIPNFGIAIIILTILIRVVLLPLGIKQIKSMQAMQAIQPKVKELQKKYKGNKQKAQEETMKLYREHGVNPLGGCLPLLLQFPLLVAMYAVVRPPSLLPVNTDGERPVPVVVVEGQERAAYVDQIGGYEVHNNHLPVDSELFQNVVTHHDLDFLWLNLQCSAAQAGTSAQIVDTSRQPVEAGKPLLSDTGGEFPNNFKPLSEAKQDCGNSVAQKVPYFLFLAAMIGTTFFQQRQMQRASPPGASSSQQQVLLKVMPVMFGIFGFTFPSGLVVYWTTANFWQIGQQALLMKAGHIGPDALERRKQELADRPAKQKKGLLSGLMERAQDERERRTPRKPASGGKPPVRKNPSSGGRKPSSGSRPTGGRKPPPGRKKPGGSSGSSNGKGRPNR
jgi:YidC/Oxa1 family membrane protein insertase